MTLSRLLLILAGIGNLTLAGCGGGARRDFSLEISPASVTLVSGGAAETFAISATPVNGFNGSIALQVGALPAGVTATPSAMTFAPDSLASITITASAAALAGTSTITVTGTSGTLTHSATFALTINLPPAPDFTLEVAPTPLTLVSGGAPQPLTIGVISLNGFAGSVSVQAGTLPAGVSASPSSVSLTPGTLQQITLTASSAAPAGTASILLTGVSGALTHTASVPLTINPAPIPQTGASLSGILFDFGENLVNNAVVKNVVVATNTGPNPLTLNPTLSGDASYSIVTANSCGSQLAPGAQCSVVVQYDPATPSSPQTQEAVLNMGFVNVPVGTPQTVAITGISGALTAGQVTSTNNPQVALYTLTLPFPGSMQVNFGTTTNYGLSTWSQSTDVSGGQISIFVAGMLQRTTYHMQAQVTFSDGITGSDADHTFATGNIPANMKIDLTATTTPGMTPQPGLELLDALAGPVSGVLVTDLEGNTLWTYTDPGNQALNTIQGVKMLPNGDLLLGLAANSSDPLNGGVPEGTISSVREVNLAGDTVREITLEDLNAALAVANCAECKVVLSTLHHDVTPLPNGHWLVLGNTLQALSSTSTPPLTNYPAVTVLGDVIVDLDQNLQPVWAWNEFNHLDPNRHPYMFPDWTHTNAVLYSPGDGNLLVSLRHQNWILKVDYANGSGKGDILWHLGEGGDFTLQGGVDPTDWQYAQHDPAFFSPNTTGVFSLGVMDNGDDREFPAGVTCGASGAPPCQYTTIPVFQIDETAKTATLTFHQILPSPSLYSFFGGNIDPLANGDIEYDLCGLGAGTGQGSAVYEVTPDNSNPQTVWNIQVTHTNLYRAFRIPSLYPGVQW